MWTVIAIALKLPSSHTFPQCLNKNTSLFPHSYSSYSSPIIPTLFPPSFPFSAHTAISTSCLLFPSPPLIPPVYILPIAPVLPHLSNLLYSPPSSPQSPVSMFFYPSAFPLLCPTTSASFSTSALPPCPSTPSLSTSSTPAPSPPSSPLPPGVPSHFRRDRSVPEVYI